MPQHIVKRVINCFWPMSLTSLIEICIPLSFACFSSFLLFLDWALIAFYCTLIHDLPFSFDMSTSWRFVWLYLNTAQSIGVGFHVTKTNLCLWSIFNTIYLEEVCVSGLPWIDALPCPRALSREPAYCLERSSCIKICLRQELCIRSQYDCFISQIHSSYRGSSQL